MKLTRRQLNTLVENYLESDDSFLNEVQVQRFSAPEVDQCDFVPNKEFFEYFTIMFTGKGKRRGIYSVDRGDLPTWISPAFETMFADAAGPLLNAYGMIPVFNQKGKCDLLQKIQDIFIKYKREYGEGIELNKEPEKPCPKCKKADCECALNNPIEDKTPTPTIDISTVPQVIVALFGKYGYGWPETSKSQHLGVSGGALTREETYLATLILGNLDDARSSVTNTQLVYNALLNLERKRKVKNSEIVASNKNLDNDQKALLRRVLDLQEMPEEKIIVKAMISVIEKLSDSGFFS